MVVDDIDGFAKGIENVSVVECTFPLVVKFDVMASGGLGVCSHGAVDFCLFEVGGMLVGMLLAGWEDGLEIVCDGLVILFECEPSYKRIWCPLPSASLQVDCF